MKIWGVAASALLLVLTGCRVVTSLPQLHTATNTTTLIKIFGTPPVITSDSGSIHLAPRTDPLPPNRPIPVPSLPPAGPVPDAPAVEPESEWDRHVCRGEKLTQASNLSKRKAEAIALPVETQWYGNLEAERKKWGYFDSEDPDCGFEGSYYDITRALEALGLTDGDCFRTQYYDPESDEDIKDQKYKVGEKVFRATGAHGTFGINVEEGALFLIDVASGPRTAARIWDVDPVPKDQLPGMRQISDLAWGFWYQAHGGLNLGHITKFIVTQVINQVTERLIDQALKTYEIIDGEEQHEAVPEWPCITFGIDTPSGKALLGSPVGIATAYFLSQHKQEIGLNKYVSKVTVFRADEDTDMEEPTIIYHVEDAPTTWQEESSLGLISERNARQEQDHTRRDLLLVTDDLVSATDEDEIEDLWYQNLWYKSLCRGGKLTEGCMANKNEATEFLTPVDTPWKGTMESELQEWGYREVDASSKCGWDDIEENLNRERIRVEDAVCYEVQHALRPGTTGENGETIALKDQTYTPKNGRKYRMTNARARIGINTVSGAIFFLDVESAAKAAEVNWKPQVPAAEELPKLKAISDISWGFWNRAWMKRPTNERKLGDINYFIVHNIVNEETEVLISKAMELHLGDDGSPTRFTVLPKWPGLDFYTADKTGKALLGSPNGLAAGYFLSQHKDEIGANKYVYGIRVFASSQPFIGPSMMMYVTDVDDDSSEEMPEDRRRSVGPDSVSVRPSTISSNTVSPLAFGDAVSIAAKPKLDDDTLWDTCKCRGEKITQASLQDKEIAKNFVSPIDSPWEGTMEEELKLWGYMQPKGATVYCDFSSTEKEFSAMGIDTKFKERTKEGKNRCYQAHHSRGGPRGKVREQTYEVKKKTYRMTDAIMQMGVNIHDGVLTFFNVRSAEQSAMLLWGVDEVSASELPALNRVSDISWAFWKRAHENDAGLDNIQKFHVHDAVNEDTLRLVNMALETYHVPDGDIRRSHLPKWPGLVFDTATDEGAAMLGSPNGIAAGYFLVQHKTQLGGNKYIHQVTLWMSSDGDVQMMFWVKDAPPPQAAPQRQSVREGPVPVVKVTKRSQDGRNIIREHRLLAKL